LILPFCELNRNNGVESEEMYEMFHLKVFPFQIANTALGQLLRTSRNLVTCSKHAPAESNSSLSGVYQLKSATIGRGTGWAEAPATQSRASSASTRVPARVAKVFTIVRHDA